MPDISPYQWLHRLGAGTSGEVWAARRDGKELAVKVLHKHHDAKHIEAIEREITLGPLLQGHPGVVAVTHSHTLNGSLHLEMEWIKGPNLSQVQRGWISAQKTLLPASIAVPWAIQILQTLHWAQRRVCPESPEQFIHRDIKPANLLLDPSGRVKVTDFGIARAEASLGFLPTQAGVIKGSPRFMAPELLNEQNVDARVDQFSVGLVLYELLAGSPMYDGQGTTQIILEAAKAKVEPQLSRLKQPLALVAVLRKMLSVKADERFLTAEDAAIALESLGITGPSIQQVVGDLLRCAEVRIADRDPSTNSTLIPDLATDDIDLDDVEYDLLDVLTGASTGECEPEFEGPTQRLPKEIALARFQASEKKRRAADRQEEPTFLVPQSPRRPIGKQQSRALDWPLHTQEPEELSLDTVPDPAGEPQPDQTLSANIEKTDEAPPRPERSPEKSLTRTSSKAPLIFAAIGLIVLVFGTGLVIGSSVLILLYLLS